MGSSEEVPSPTIPLQDYLWGARAPKLKTFGSLPRGKKNLGVTQQTTVHAKANMALKLMPFHDEVFNFNASCFIQTLCLPEKAPMEMSQLTLPIPSNPDIITRSLSNLAIVSDEKDIVSWLHDAPLHTVVEICKQLGQNDWYFKEADFVGQDKSRCFKWGKQVDQDLWVTYMVVAVYSPWEPDAKEAGAKKPDTRLQHLGDVEGPAMWFKSCRQMANKEKTRFFIATTYDEWVFGTFIDEDFKVAMVTSARSREDGSRENESKTTPTILQLLLYWGEMAKRGHTEGRSKRDAQGAGLGKRGPSKRRRTKRKQAPESLPEPSHNPSTDSPQVPPGPGLVPALTSGSRYCHIGESTLSAREQHNGPFGVGYGSQFAGGGLPLAEAFARESTHVYEHDTSSEGLTLARTSDAQETPPRQSGDPPPLMNVSDDSLCDSGCYIDGTSQVQLGPSYSLTPQPALAHDTSWMYGEMMNRS
ncbi:hypothetical protein BOTBODRAFT_54668 [Botryobasidium botryosum FD-172 SS1]|uniref:Uncharacterized protein n=1 Tax=Botryobasidium botryosum (strain FD-172 SS1) TaxID=930990 RepID=A0A067MIN8_BOTB1|nr:hypothetical protein BOTBODRAFT_54668 [Botryobasidium botryosum FD-172 SS1]